MPNRACPAVLHLGLFGDRPGGMAQVVNEYLSWSQSDFRVTATLTTRRRRDPLSPILYLLAAGRVIAWAVQNRRLQGRRPVVAHLSEGGSFLREGSLILLAKCMGCRTVVQLHGASFAEFAARHSESVRRVLSRTDRVLVLTSESEAICKNLGVTQVVRIDNPVPMPDCLELPSDPPKVFLFSGEIGERKGADRLISAWRLLQRHSRLPGWELHFAGPMLMPYPEDVRGLRFLGVLPHAELLRVLRNVRYCVLPSRGEALPIAILEALAHGRPTIATNVGQISEVVNQDTGWLLKEDCGAIELAESLALAGSLSDDEYSRLSAAAMRKIAERYSSQVVKRQTMPLWLDDSV